MSRKTYFYTAFGLTIRSELALHGVQVAARRDADILVRFASVGRPSGRVLRLDDRGREFASSRNDVWYSVPETGRFLVRGGNEILVEPDDGVDDAFLRLPVIGPCMGLALYQRGVFVLHASAVNVCGGVVAFLGAHASGKSTLAATLHRWGHTFVTDDLLALVRNGRSYNALPSYPQSKLWPDAMASLGLDLESHALVHPRLPKRGVAVVDSFDVAPSPMKRIYVIDRGAEYVVESLPPQEAMFLLLGHWYGARFGPDFLRGSVAADHFERVADVVRTVPVRRLRRPVRERTGAAHTRELERVLMVDLGA